ncbi:mycothiol synthase [Alloactinosynnema sp. L-07]|uniref:mycothiol synthase n=1 Tax=Alloactinosynnema sp. L-07 TaxID=1653480 RepID=UPI000A9F361E|nr:mycothiol synthase [Alloactinosynnema sp. L-07]
MALLSWHSEFDPRPLLLAVAAADGRPEVTAEGPLPREFRGGEHLVATADGVTVGYAHLDTQGDAFGREVVEAFVHPDHRGAGIGTELVRALLDRAAPGARFWSHGDHPAAAAIAAKAGLGKVRELLKMRLDVAGVPLAEPKWPAGVRVRTFVPGQDEAALVAVNRRAFDWHPEQGALTVADVEDTAREPWFDPEGLFLAVDAADHLLGFHWTKTHPGGEGEVYVVGVDPAAQGGGLGKALTLAGLRHLVGRGLSEVILYVEADNVPAVTVYRGLGFERAEAHIQYSLVDTERTGPVT